MTMMLPVQILLFKDATQVNNYKFVVVFDLVCVSANIILLIDLYICVLFAVESSSQRPEGTS